MKLVAQRHTKQWILLTVKANEYYIYLHKKNYN